MLTLNSNYVALVKCEEPPKEGFQTVDVQDSFVCKGKVAFLPEQPVYLSNHALIVGEVVLFAKYSPDTHEVEQDGMKLKFVNTSDLLAVL